LIINKVYKILYMFRLGYRGVIIGLYEVAMAPEQWLKLMHRDHV